MSSCSRVCNCDRGVSGDKDTVCVTPRKLIVRDTLSDVISGRHNSGSVEVEVEGEGEALKLVECG